jgi:hypothetical protein
MKCIYELNINQDQIKEELNFLNNPRFKDRGYDDLCFYVSDETARKQGCDAVIKFKEDIGGMLEGIRFLNMKHKEHYGFHVDSNEQGYHPEIPLDILLPGVINFLLSEPAGDTTYWSVDPNMRNLWPWAFAKRVYRLYRDDVNDWIDESHMNTDPDSMEIVDKFQIADKPVLFDVSTWHSIKCEDAEKTRQMACFVFWPYLTFSHLVHNLQNRGLLIER